jgi:dihydrofolate reductase
VSCSRDAAHTRCRREPGPERSGDRFADWINRAQKYVVSDTLSDGDLTWKPATIIRGAELVDSVASLRDKPGGGIYVYGSVSVVRSLLTAGLVDELVLLIEPITLGGGKTLFPPTVRRAGSN